MQDLRCESGRLHGRLTDDGRLEVRCQGCQSAFRHVYRQRVVVLHYFAHGELVDTKVYGDPVYDHQKEPIRLSALREAVERIKTPKSA